MPQFIATLIKGDKVSSRVDYRDALPINMYAVERPMLGADGYMLEYPGLEYFGTGIGADRGAVYNERLGKHIRLSGNKVIEVSPTGEVTTLGTIFGSGQATLENCYSFNTQCIIANKQMFLYDGSSLKQVTDSDLGEPIDAVWVDGYYFLTDGEYIYHTDITDEFSIDPLKYATAEFMPDPSIAVAKTQDNKVIVFGRYTVEYFTDQATANFAFQRIESRALTIGLVATHAKAETGNGWYIVGSRKNEALGVYILGIGSYSKISTREIDDILGQYTDSELANIRLETRNERGTTFIILHLPNEVLCFNETIASTKGIAIAWSILKSDITGNTPHRAINGILDPRSNVWVYGDKVTTDLGIVNHSINTQYGNTVEWILFTPFMKLETFSIDEVELEVIPGFNISQDAKIAISITEDGYTYGQEAWLVYGEKGIYNSSVIAYALGYVEGFIGLKFRGVSSSRMAFGALRVTYG